MKARLGAGPSTRQSAVGEHWKTWAELGGSGKLPYLFRVAQLDFPSGPVVKTLPRNAGDVGLIPGWGAKIPCAS